MTESYRSLIRLISSSNERGETMLPHFAPPPELSSAAASACAITFSAPASRRLASDGRSPRNAAAGSAKKTRETSSASNFGGRARCS